MFHNAQGYARETSKISHCGNAIFTRLIVKGERTSNLPRAKECFVPRNALRAFPLDSIAKRNVQSMRALWRSAVGAKPRQRGRAVSGGRASRQSNAAAPSANCIAWPLVIDGDKSGHPLHFEGLAIVRPRRAIKGKGDIVVILH